MNNKTDLLENYLQLVLEANNRVNLTRIDSIEQAHILHLEDSLVALPEIEAAPEGLYGDLGTGGGFPGVPLAIVTGRETLLVDSVKKKMAIVESILDQMELSPQIKTYAGRIEELSLERKGGFSVLTARALTQLPSLIELAAPLLKKGGQLICYKANISEEEMKGALDIEELVGMRRTSQRRLTLSDDITHREIIVFTKIGKPKLKLPRRIGLAQHSPLKPRG
ncbi:MULTISPECIES: 16S rRNA (guanine(527)-N(7))-methyltransferase RsmG [unclassified Adlercreutzia]|uniref:16S rRNA (guanine(527)-N(7))-methyltransferase RsmG n=1 Tax=unclassified Adlercreutzia TaxID=2636013 RepID=UPI0013EDF478|nr:MULTISPECIES: 16S rRNA (guanine(527)-N(7))-methyltransferase RsmG [unclassified Adlercreutzia]